MTIVRKTIVYASSLAIPMLSCTINFLSIHDKIPATSNKIEKKCEIVYTFELESGYSLAKGRVLKEADDMLLFYKYNYIKQTEDTFGRMGCLARYTANSSEANFSIKILRLIDASPSRAKELTYRTFGIIPSWYLERNKYSYTFDDLTNNRVHSYHVSQIEINHLFMIPFYWTQFLLPGEFDAYHTALANFMKSDSNTKGDTLLEADLSSILSKGIQAYEQRNEIIHYSATAGYITNSLCADAITLNLSNILGQRISDQSKLTKANQLNILIQFLRPNKARLIVNGDIASFVFGSYNNLFERSNCEVGFDQHASKRNLKVTLQRFDLVFYPFYWEGNVEILLEMDGRKVLLTGFARRFNWLGAHSGSLALEESFKNAIENPLLIDFLRKKIDSD